MLERNWAAKLVMCFMLYSGAGLAVPMPEMPQNMAETDMQITAYLPSDENFPNPERGFYSQDAPLWMGKDRVPQKAGALRALRKKGVSLARWYFLLDEFRTKRLSAEVLDYIKQQFAVARQAGIKIIPRFAYNFPTGGSYPFHEPDATLSQTLEHIDQLAPLLQDNADVIAFMEIGFVGAWGEWHSSTHKLVDDEHGINAASRKIVKRLLEILPSERMLAMRYPKYKQQLYGAQAMSSRQAFTETAKARMGAHDDCFLASYTNYGTYPAQAAQRAATRQYLHKDNRYVPQGGETCNVGKDAQPYIGCNNALKDMALLRFSALNRDYHRGVLQRWRNEGCYDEIAQRLGYRLRLTQSEIPSSIHAGKPFPVHLWLVNEGFAAPYNPRDFEIILRSVTTGKRYVLSLNHQPDPRRWLPDPGEIHVLVGATAPANIPAGKYEVLLNLPDPDKHLHGRADYSIRLANKDTWESGRGYNNLLINVQVQK